MKEKFEILILDAFEELNSSRAEPIPTDDLRSLALYGDNGVFDSMQLVNFLMLLEEKIEDAMGVSLSLTSERAVSRRISPFRSVSYLIDFIIEEIDLAESDKVNSAA